MDLVDRYKDRFARSMAEEILTALGRTTHDPHVQGMILAYTAAAWFAVCRDSMTDADRAFEQWVTCVRQARGDMIVTMETEVSGREVRH